MDSININVNRGGRREELIEVPICGGTMQNLQAAVEKAKTELNYLLTTLIGQEKYSASSKREIDEISDEEPGLTSEKDTNKKLKT